MKRRGFTLIEVMVTMAIFATTMAAFAGSYATTTRLGESSRNLTQVMNDARIILEAMRDTAQSGGLKGVPPIPPGVPGVTDLFPPGVVLPATLPGIAAWSLPNEVISVSYVNLGDLLSVTLNISWIERGRARMTSVNTMLTRR